MRDEKRLKKRGIKLKEGKMKEGKKEEDSTSSLIPHPSSLVSVIMGSKSDWETMQRADEMLDRFGVPHKSRALKGMDSLLSIVQMPAGIPVGTLAIGEAGATNAALLAVAILANTRPHLRERLRRFRDEQPAKVLEATLPS